MEKIYHFVLLLSIMASDCFLHYESVEQNKKVSTVTAKGEKEQQLLKGR